MFNGIRFVLFYIPGKVHNYSIYHNSLDFKWSILFSSPALPSPGVAKIQVLRHSEREKGNSLDEGEKGGFGLLRHWRKVRRIFFFPAVNFFHYWICFFFTSGRAGDAASIRCSIPLSGKAAVVCAGLGAEGGKGAHGRGGGANSRRRRLYRLRERHGRRLRRAAIRNTDL